MQNVPRPSWQRRLLAVACLCLVAAPAVAGDAAVPVTVATATSGDVPIIREGIGTVQALNTATIRVQVSGVLENVAFHEGQMLKKGQIIAQIDPRPFEAQVDQAEATVARDKAAATNAELNLKRTKPLANRGFASNQQLDTQSTTVDQANSTVKLDEAALEAARIQLAFTTITAPFDGVAGLRLTDIGNVVHPNDATGLVVLTQIEPINIVFTLPSADIPAVQAAMGRGEVKAIAFAADDKTRLDEGHLVAISNLADPTSGTVQLKAEFPNAAKRLWPGTFVNAHLVIDVRHDGITVPLAAIQQGPNGAFVYVVDKASTAQMQAVTVEQSRGGRALVASGLRDGETVVVDGQYGVTEGAKVEVVAGDAARHVQSSTSASAGMLP